MDMISDLLTRVRNANHRQFEKVDVPMSKQKVAVARVLKDQGFISNYKVVEEEGAHPVLRVFLRYTPDHQRVIHGIERVSRPGLRVYRDHQELARMLDDLKVWVVSTSQGLMTAREACRARLGGEVVCQIW